MTHTTDTTTIEDLAEAEERGCHWLGSYAWRGGVRRVVVETAVKASWPRSEAHGDTVLVRDDAGQRQVVTLYRAYRASQGEYDIHRIVEIDEIDWADYDV